MRDQKARSALLPGEVPVALNQHGAPPWPLAGGGESAADDVYASARKFITLFHAENHAGPPFQRLWRVHREIEETGTYWHTPEELAFGARAAWRNSTRCIGRPYWHSLEVRDRREVTSAPAITAECTAHLREATNGGQIRPMITVFAPDRPYLPGPRIINSQLVRYAGHETADGAVVGDPANVDVTRLARHLGWSGGRPASRFDVLPLIVEEGGGLATLHELPADAVLEVMIRHPDLAWFAGLGLRWYAVPMISDMYLDIGGVRYPAAPFNGWHVCAEIGSRGLGDASRYDQLRQIAQQLGLAMDPGRRRWKDRAMTELNLAVLHSFTASGVTISDNHPELARLLQHMRREERHDRACPADQTPNLYRHPAPAQLIGLSSRDVSGPVPAGHHHPPPSVADAPLIGVPEGRFME
ncbi:MAG: nitric oxide synthase oxygenase [Streptosporangiaceae bacterium]